MKSNKNSLIIKTLSLFVFIIITGLNHDCKSPDEYKPEDTLMPPPEPPELFTPIDSFVHMPDGSNKLLFTWELIEDAEIYEIYYKGKKTKEWILQRDTNYIAQNWITVSPDTFTWKVRAYNSKWQYYTDWSKSRQFEIRPKPGGPLLFYPPDDTVFTFDTFPADINFLWSSVQDEQYYEIRLLLDSIEIYSVTTPNTQTILTIDSSATYYWWVRACSKYWESPGWWSISGFHVVRN